jgi:tetratricopeptide (TPR) repeat protein
MVQLAGLYADQDRVAEAADLFLEVADLVQGPRSERLDDPVLEAEWASIGQIALQNAGQLLFQLQRYPASADAFRRARQNEPDDIAIVSSLAAALTLAGDTDEAQAIYDQLLGRPDLTPRDLLNIGTGLSEGGNELQAARAFERAHERIPQDREALYNQAQSLYFAADAADTTAAPALWTEVYEAGQELVQIDTHSRNAYRMVITALARLARESEVDPILAEFEALPFEITGIGMGQLPDGWAVAGRVTTLAAGSPGATVNLRMHFYAENGSLVGTENFQVTLSAVDQATEFQVDLVTNTEIFGYRYEVQ